MNGAREKILAERAALIERAEDERVMIAHQFEKWERPLKAVDLGLSVLRVFRNSFWLRIAAGAGMAALAIARPRSIVGWVLGGQAAWRLLARLRP